MSKHVEYDVPVGRLGLGPCMDLSMRLQEADSKGTFYCLLLFEVRLSLGVLGDLARLFQKADTRVRDERLLEPMASDMDPFETDGLDGGDEND